MRFRALLRFLLVASVLVGTALVTRTATAATWGALGLLAKNWAVGYALVGLAVLLGLLAVTVTSRRKTVRKRD
jgi:hypothetical protein